MPCQSITIAWYALHGDPAGDVRARRMHAPWYPSKRAPSMLDIQASLRRALIGSEYHKRPAGQNPRKLARPRQRPPPPPDRSRKSRSKIPDEECFEKS